MVFFHDAAGLVSSHFAVAIVLPYDTIVIAYCGSTCFGAVLYYGTIVILNLAGRLAGILIVLDRAGIWVRFRVIRLRCTVVRNVAIVGIYFVHVGGDFARVCTDIFGGYRQI